MIESAVHVHEANNKYQNLNLLDIMLILNKNGKVETDIYYKDTNTHDYLNYHSDHPLHVKNNIPFNLAKRIIVFCSNEDTEKRRLSQLKEWLIKSNYPQNVIERGFKNAMLQGPANKKINKNITFVTSHASNYDSRHVTQKAETLMKECRNEKLKNIFKDTKVTLALKQPPSILRLLTIADVRSACL